MPLEITDSLYLIFLLKWNEKNVDETYGNVYENCSFPFGLSGAGGVMNRIIPTPVIFAIRRTRRYE